MRVCHRRCPGTRANSRGPGADDGVDLATGCGEVEPLELAQQHKPGPWRASTSQKYDPEPSLSSKRNLFSAAKRAWPMAILEVAGVDAEPRQNLLPATPRAIHGIHADPPLSRLCIGDFSRPDPGSYRVVWRRGFLDWQGDRVSKFSLFLLKRNRRQRIATRR